MLMHLWEVYADDHHGALKIVTYDKQLSEVEDVCESHDIYEIEAIKYLGEVLK